MPPPRAPGPRSSSRPWSRRRDYRFTAYGLAVWRLRQSLAASGRWAPRHGFPHRLRRSRSGWRPVGGRTRCNCARSSERRLPPGRGPASRRAGRGQDGRGPAGAVVWAARDDCAVTSQGARRCGLRVAAGPPQRRLPPPRAARTRRESPFYPDQGRWHRRPGCARQDAPIAVADFALCRVASGALWCCRCARPTST